jgi:predicted  nucleic acid-binding Zn-ribbon protein
MGEYVAIEVHNEFARRIEDESNRINHRLTDLEDAVKEMTRLTVSVEKMAVSLESMAEEQKKQGSRLDAIEEKPAKRWDTVISGIISGVIGILIGLVSAGIIK